jgi:signal transduction histidine kinase
VHLQAGQLPPLDSQRETVIYRVAQEAISNALRHSGSAAVKVSLTARQHRVVLEVADSGSGFDPDAPRPGLGLASMRERAASAGARLSVTSAPGAGTVVRLSVPAGPRPSRKPQPGGPGAPSAEGGHGR